MFRGKESSNRIELSRLVQDLLNFGVFSSLWLWGWGGVDRGGWVVVGGCPPHTYTYTCMHACTCACGKHDNFMQMAVPIGGISGNSLWCHTRMRVHACAHMWGTPSHHPPHLPTPLHPQEGDPRNQSKFNST